MMNMVKLPNDWKDKVEYNVVYKDFRDFATKLNITIKEGTDELQQLKRQVEKHFVLEYQPPKDKRNKKGNGFKIVAKKQVPILVTVTEEELQLLEQLRKDDEQQ